MDPMVLVAILIVLLVVIVAGFLLWGRPRRSQQLQEHFGPEYDRAVEREGDRRTAERELEARRRRRQRLDVRPLEPDQQEDYVRRWRAVQARFVDQPVDAVVAAHHLVTSVMRDRGYPMEDFEQRAADISVDHPEIVEDYRVAYRIARSSEDGDASTEDLREAVVRYRSLFARLLDLRGEERHTDTTEGSAR
jgi:hypothetical protein